MKKKPKYLGKEKTPYEVALDKLSMFNHKDLQTECIERGMEFNKIVEDSHSRLAEWFIEHFEDGKDPTNLDKYDIWVDEQLEKRGHKKGDAIMHPSLRFGLTKLEIIPDKTLFKPQIQNNEKGPEIPRNSDKGIQKPTEKRQTDTITGVKSGTKKNLTYTLTYEGVEIAEIIKKVKLQFPDAEEKSLKIWNKRALKQMKDEG